MLVVAEVSSRNTRCSGSRAGWRRMKAWRASATSGRCCSAAGRLFFKGDVVRLEKARDGALANGDAVPLDQRAADLLQRQVRLMGDQRQHGVPMFTQPRATITAHGTSPGVSFGTQTLPPPTHGPDPDPLGGSRSR